VLALLLIALVPAAMTVAILRYQLLDIRLVFSRAVLYAVITAAVIGTYVGLVTVADVVRQGIGLGSPVLATLIIAVGFNPVRVRLQRLVDRALYGDRADPARMGERLAAVGTGADPTDVLNAVREALRLPYAAVRAEDAERAAVGVSPELLESIPLIYRGERVGELVVGARSGQPDSTRRTVPPWSYWPPRWPWQCTRPRCRRRCNVPGSTSWLPWRKSAAGCAGTCTTAWALR